MSDTERKNSAFWKKHPYLEVYTYFVGYSMLYLGPICLIGGIIEHGWSTDALTPLIALTCMAIGFPILVFCLLCLLRGILS